MRLVNYGIDGNSGGLDKLPQPGQRPLVSGVEGVPEEKDRIESRGGGPVESADLLIEQAGGKGVEPPHGAEGRITGLKGAARDVAVG